MDATRRPNCVEFYRCYTIPMITASLQTISYVGSIRRFGKFGVLYEVLRIINATTALIRVIETGEETTYPLADLLLDPVE